MTMETKYTQFLNALSDVEVDSLYDVMWQNLSGKSQVVQVTGCTAEGLAQLRGNDLATFCPAGPFWVDWARCDLVGLATTDGGHPRWQPRVKTAASGLTPASLTSLGQQVKSVLTEAHWEQLKQNGSQAKIQCHHLAVRCSTGHPLLPALLGAGSSVSHLCDQLGCARPEHLEISASHIDNLSRQRCRGVTLMVYDGVITYVIPCTHGSLSGSVGQLEEEIMGSCREVDVHVIPETAAQAIVARTQEWANRFTEGGVCDESGVSARSRR
jgi:hypothetical protein